jgi:hypothetical protein
MAKNRFKINLLGFFELETEGWKPSQILLALLAAFIFILIALALTRGIKSPSFVPEQLIKSRENSIHKQAPSPQKGSVMKTANNN